MLWPLILPAQITFCIFLSTIFVFVILAPLWKWKRLTTLLIGIFLSLFLFIPSCMGIRYVIDQHRFGWASYPDFPSIRDFRVERYIPPQATQITVFKRFGGNGYLGRFHISPRDLTTWHDQNWATFLLRPESHHRRHEDDMKRQVPEEMFDLHFGKSGWKAPGDLLEFEGPRAPNGAGYTIDYSPSEHQAYVNGYYW